MNTTIELEELTFLDSWVIQNGKKYESATMAADGQYVIVATAFNSSNDDPPGRSVYSCMLSWKKSIPGAAQLAYPTVKNYYLSSDDLRQKITTALATAEFPDGVPWFNIEGMTALPDNQLLLGIRQFGESYKNFDYAVKLLQGTYRIDPKFGVVLEDDLKVVYDKDPRSFAGIDKELAVASLEYDWENNRLYMLTSYEEGEGDRAEDIDAYLWTINLEDMAQGADPRPVLDESGQPIQFDRKMEGLALLPEDRLFIVADDDGVSDAGDLPRKLNQAGFVILEVNEVVISVISVLE